MKIDIVKVGYLQENCYILEKNNTCIIVDPGADLEKIEERLNKRKLLGILITHNHFDHIGAVEGLKEKYDVKVFDINNLSEGIHNIGNFDFEVIYTPGHSKDSITYYFRNDNIMFVGDFIFKEDIGRCDLPTGNSNEMYNSIIKIKAYDDATIYPGHGEVTTLSYERKNNPYFKIERA